MIKAPGYLRLPTQAWMQSLAEDFALEAHHLRLLVLASEAWDRGQEARERIAKDGAYIADRFGQLHAHPAVAVERDSRLAFARLIRELGLDSEPDESRPPRLVGRYAS